MPTQESPSRVAAFRPSASGTRCPDGRSSRARLRLHVVGIRQPVRKLVVDPCGLYQRGYRPASRPRSYQAFVGSPICSIAGAGAPASSNVVSVGMRGSDLTSEGSIHGLLPVAI